MLEKVPTKCIQYMILGICNKIILSSAADPDPDPHRSVLILNGWIRIQEGKNEPQK
jgi:hypothetical protein